MNSLQLFLFSINVKELIESIDVGKSAEKTFFIVKLALKLIAKAGHVSEFTAKEDLAFVRDTAAAKAHTASHGETQLEFWNITKKLKGNYLSTDVVKSDFEKEKSLNDSKKREANFAVRMIKREGERAKRKEEQEPDRQERLEDRQERNRLEPKKFKIVMSAFVGKK